MSRKRRSKAAGKSAPATVENDGSSFELDPTWLWVAASVVLAAYVYAFSSTQLGGEDGVPRGLLYLLVPFAPAELLGGWIGGSWSRVGILDRAPVLALILLWLASAHAAGAMLLRTLRVDIGNRCSLTHIVFATPIGLHLLSLGVLILGLLAKNASAPWLLSRWPLLVMLVGLLAMALLHPAWVAPWWRANSDIPDEALEEIDESASDRGASDQAASDRGASDRGKLASNANNPPSIMEVAQSRWLLLLAIPFATLLIACSILPPWEFDVREYHLQAPKEWYRGGGVSFLPHNVYANMPLGAEMHALGGMILWGGDDGWWRGALVGKGILGAINLLTALALYVGASRAAGRFAGSAAAVFYVSWPFAFHNATAGLIDAALAMYVVLTFLAFERWRQATDEPHQDASRKTQRDWLIVAALVAGAAAACKYPGLLLAAAPLAVAVFAFSLRPRGAGQALRAASIGLAIALAVASPWYIKNLLLTGNPTYPLLSSTLGGETRTEAKNQQWRKAHATPQDSDGRSFTTIQWTNAAAQLLWQFPKHHPLVVPFALLALATAASRRRAVSIWAAIGLLFLLWFLCTHRIDRFWLPIGPLLCLAAGIGVATGKSVYWRRAATAIIASASFLVFCYCASRYATPENRVLVAYSELRRDVSHEADPLQWTLTPSHDFLNQATPADSAVLLVGDAQPFNLSPHAYYSTCFDDCLLETWMQDGSASLQAELKRKRVAFVLVHWGEIARYRATYGFTEFVQRELFAQLVGEGVLKPVAYPGESPQVQIFEVLTP